LEGPTGEEEGEAQIEDMLFGGGGNCMRKEEEHVRGTSW